MSNRELHVKYNNTTYYAYIPSSGIPQGTSCGPLGFIVHINVLNKILKFAEALFFADDCKILARIKSNEVRMKLQKYNENFNIMGRKKAFEFNVQMFCLS